MFGLSSREQALKVGLPRTGIVCNQEVKPIRVVRIGVDDIAHATAGDVAARERRKAGQGRHQLRNQALVTTAVIVQGADLLLRSGPLSLNVVRGDESD